MHYQPPVYTPALVSPCFTPRQNCRGDILRLIYSAKKTIRVQGYFFTSYKMANALVKMKNRGIDVKVILDKSQFQCGQRSQRTMLIKGGVAIWEDFKPNIAHNKIIIVDGETVETGSYNFTPSAQFYNAENIVLIKSPKIAQSYLKNWRWRQSLSKPIHDLRCQKPIAAKKSTK
ncbi:MAG: phospholipase [Coxiella sp. (in: Bacteria)]|nr:MAG: phospholipase [Coxiella sp. (in: g-proteobacteria)]